MELKVSPANIVIIDKRQINQSGAKHLGEVLEIFVPGFQYMFNQWNGDIWAIRGVTADQNNKILFLVNGMKMNLQARNGAVTEMNLGLMGDIERIEVLQGPAGMVYGSGAIAGVVNIITDSDEKEESGSILLSGSRDHVGFEGKVSNRFKDKSVLTVSGGFRNDGGNGDGRTRIFGYQDWPENTSFSGQWPSKGSYGETPGNARASLDFKWKDLRIQSRMTRQQHSSAGLYARYPWDYHNEIHWNPVSAAPDFVLQADSTITTRGDTTIKVYFNDTLFITDKAKWLADTNSVVAAHNAKYFPDVEIDGKTYSYSPEMMALYKQANQTRRFVLDNLAVEASFTRAFGDCEVTLKAGAIANQNQSYFENQGFNQTRSPWSTDFFWPDLLWSTFGERRYHGIGLLRLQPIEDFQSVVGVEYRYDDIGQDFQGRNMQWGSEAMHVVTPVVYHNFAAFTENLYQPLEPLNLLAGARFDKHTRNNGILSPKLAGILTVAGDHVFKLIWQMSSNNGDADSYEYNGNHYRFDGSLPGRDVQANLAGGQSSTTDTSSVIVVPSQDELRSLEPERSSSIEFISTHGFWSDRLQLNSSLSLNIIEDNFMWNGNLQRKVNIGDYKSLGVEIGAVIRQKTFTVSLNHAFQRPVDTDKDQVARYTVAYHEWDSVGVEPGTGRTLYALANKDVSRSMTRETALLKESVTFDGDNFLNVVTHCTKIIADWSPLPRLTLNTNIRAFWGFAGREQVNSTVFPEGEEDAQKNAEYLGFDGRYGWENAVAVKWNLGAHLELPHRWSFSFFALNVLGESDNIHAIRWQNMVSNLKQRKLYTTDTRSFEARITKDL